MILGIDPGARRTGIAIADEETRFARPLEVISSEEPAHRIEELVAELHVTLVVVGKPVSLSGVDGHAVAAQSVLVEELKTRLAVPVVEHDERLTTVIAEQGMRSAGTKAKDRKSLRDAVAAQVMLQGFLDTKAS